MAWVETNDLAWSAFGFDPKVARAAHAAIALDDDSAAALMHPSSRQQWQGLVERVKSQLGAQDDGAHRGDPPGLGTYAVFLYTVDGVVTEYVFTATRGGDGEIVFVGVPSAADGGGFQAAEQQALSWFDAAAAEFVEPAVVVRSDGSVASANAAFLRLAGRWVPGAQLYDFPAIGGATEANFIDQVWMPSRGAGALLPGVLLRGDLLAWGSRLAPPGAQHLEAALLVFLQPGAALPPRLGGAGQA